MLTRPGDQDGFGLLGLPEKCADLIGAPGGRLFFFPTRETPETTKA